MKDICKWKIYDDGQFGIHDWVYKTSCGKDNIDADSDLVNGDYCSFCGKKKEFTKKLM
jgi:hypothetical protein